MSVIKMIILLMCGKVRMWKGIYQLPIDVIQDEIDYYITKSSRNSMKT